MRVIDLGHVGGGQARSSGGPPPCTFEPVADSWDRDTYLVDQSDIPLAARFYWIVCADRSHLRWYLPGDPDPVAAGLLTEIIQEAFDRIQAEQPTITLSPDVDRFQLTGMPTWLAVHPDSWEPPAGSVSAGGITVEAWLDPRQVDWDLGNGDQRVCDTPGNIYDPTLAHDQQSPDCSYTYTTTPAHLSGDPDVDTYPITSRIDYAARYRIIGLPGIDGTYTLGPISGPATTTDIEVRELRAVRTTTP